MCVLCRHTLCPPVIQLSHTSVRCAWCDGSAFPDQIFQSDEGSSRVDSFVSVCSPQELWVPKPPRAAAVLLPVSSIEAVPGAGADPAPHNAAALRTAKLEPSSQASQNNDFAHTLLAAGTRPSHFALFPIAVPLDSQPQHQPQPQTRPLLRSQSQPQWQPQTPSEAQQMPHPEPQSQPSAPPPQSSLGHEPQPQPEPQLKFGVPFPSESEPEADRKLNPEFPPMSACVTPVRHRMEGTQCSALRFVVPVNSDAAAWAGPPQQASSRAKVNAGARNGLAASPFSHSGVHALVPVPGPSPSRSRPRSLVCPRLLPMPSPPAEPLSQSLFVSQSLLQTSSVHQPQSNPEQDSPKTEALLQLWPQAQPKPPSQPQLQPQPEPQSQRQLQAHPQSPLQAHPQWPAPPLVEQQQGHLESHWDAALAPSAPHPPVPPGAATAEPGPAQCPCTGDLLQDIPFSTLQDGGEDAEAVLASLVAGPAEVSFAVLLRSQSTCFRKSTGASKRPGGTAAGGHALWGGPGQCTDGSDGDHGYAGDANQGRAALVAPRESFCAGGKDTRSRRPLECGGRRAALPHCEPQSPSLALHPPPNAGSSASLGLQPTAELDLDSETAAVSGTDRPSHFSLDAAEGLVGALRPAFIAPPTRHGLVQDLRDDLLAVALYVVNGPAAVTGRYFAVSPAQFRRLCAASGLQKTAYNAHFGLCYVLAAEPELCMRWLRDSWVAAWLCDPLSKSDAFEDLLLYFMDEVL